MMNNTTPGMMNDILWDMPFTSDHLTREQFEAWLASRKEAGRVIDIETCEILRRYAYDCDPYGAAYDLPPEAKVASANRYVRSPTSNGWISDGDLPRDKFDAMYDRIERNQRLWEAACAVHPMFKAGGLWRWRWKGDGEEPSPDAMREWFKVNHPTLAREAEREIRARIKEKREREREHADDIEPPF